MNRNALVWAGAFLASVGCASAPVRAVEDPSTIRGRITVVERDGTLVVMPPEGRPKGFSAKPSAAKIERNGKPATFADLRAGDEVTVRQVGDSLQISARGP